MNLIKYQKFFFLLSLIILLPGLFSFFQWGLKLGIDFTGGTLWEVKFTEKQSVNHQDIADNLIKNNVEVGQSANTSENSALIRLKETDEEALKNIKQQVVDSFGKTEDVRFETIGPTISKELTQKAFLAVGVSIIAIVIYIAWAFRKVPKPASPIAFGVCTIFALVHDVLVVIGAFSIFGHFYNIEIDSLFITALLTVIGFSVHDTIVVFDRIRENLIRHSDQKFETVVNNSLLQTLSRSLNTSLTAILVLIALFLFGGESIKTFVLALLIGMISGTYSSLFNAAPILIVWHNFYGKIRKR